MGHVVKEQYGHGGSGADKEELFDGTKGINSGMTTWQIVFLSLHRQLSAI